MPTTHLSPAYGLSPIRLDGPQGVMPGLVLHSTSLTWPFDPDPRPLSRPGEMTIRAHKIGLWAIPNPFLSPGVRHASKPWTFHLPTPSRPAALDGPEGTVTIDRAPNITPAWWSMAVTAGAKCRLLIAACVRFPDDPAAAADTLNAAALDGRVVGATIAVEF